MSQSLETTVDRVRAGEPVTAADEAVLVDTRDILTLGMLADEIRRRRHGADTTFVRVAAVTLPLSGGHVPGIPATAREIRISGSLADLESALADVARVADAAAGRPVSAFALEDVEAGLAGLSLPALLNALGSAGVTAIGSAAIDRLTDPSASLAAVHAAGLGLARLTVHHTASVEDRLRHIRRARDVQRSLGWLTSFAPLGQSWAPGSPSTGYDDVRQVALARLLLDNIATIQVDWATHGPKLAQVALTVGADDLDMVSILDEAGDGRRRGPIEEVRRNITAAGLVPVERDGAWKRVTS